MVFVSVVVVVTGLRTVVSSEVVVVVREAVPSLLQADSDKRAASARQDRINFFMVWSEFGLLLDPVNLGHPAHDSYGVKPDPPGAGLFFRW